MLPAPEILDEGIILVRRSAQKNNARVDESGFPSILHNGSSLKRNDYLSFWLNP